MKKWVFSPFDLIAPWFICLASAGLCTWGVVAAVNEPSQIISALTGLCFVLGIPVFYIVRGRKRTPKFEVAGMGVIWGQRNQPAKELVEMWVRDFTAFWLGKSVNLTHDAVTSVTITTALIEKALMGLTVICHDNDHFSFWGRMVCGYSFGRDVAVGFKGGDMGYTALLFKHEVSHQLLNTVGVPWDEERHHRIFQRVGL